MLLGQNDCSMELELKEKINFVLDAFLQMIKHFAFPMT